MPLVSLEIDNFKSYRGKQVVGPFVSFSAVIGPNGSGKSNLMDAISFVLGVKSAQLRSSQLKDLIFRGRRMGGADEGTDEEDEGEGTARKASVTAVYREAGQEYRFQRSITLAGGSEYRINGLAMPYAKYNAKLEKFNILVKAKNFLVFQGDVEAVASQNSRDLSKLIDQISGSLELKEQYEEAKAAQDRATENSTFNFNKRRGINSELKQFKEQKSEAERFERLLEQKNELIQKQLLWTLFHIEKDLDDNETAINERNTSLQTLRPNVALAEKEVAAARAEAARPQKRISDVEKAIRRKENELQEAKQDLGATEQRITHSATKRATAKGTMESVQRDLNKRTANLAQLQRDYDTVKVAANEAEEQQRQLAESAGTVLSAENLEEYHNLKAQASLRAVEERQQLESLQRELRQKQVHAQNLEDRLATLDEQQTKLEGEEATLQERKDGLEEKQTSLQSNLTSTQKELADNQRQRSEINRKETSLNEILQVCYNKLLQAGHDQKESERDAKLKETLAMLQKIFPGVRGRVSTLCKPTQRKYDLAISTVLGRNTDAVVVDHEKTAIDCIEYLRNQRAGQASFIPLDTVQTKPINDRLRNIAKGARLAIDIIEFAPGLERAMQHACGSALVCDSMEIARSICYDKKQEVKAVTLEGNVIHKSGLITGGQTGQGNTKRWEEREVEGLHRQRDDCMAQLKELQKQKRSATDDDELTSRITRLEAELTIVRDELRGTNNRLRDIQEELQNNEQQQSTVRPQSEAATVTADRIRKRCDELSESIDAEEDDVFADFCQRIGVQDIRAYEERQLRVASKQREASLQYSTQMARLTHQANFVKQEITTLEERVDLYKRTIDKEDIKLKTLEKEKKSMQKTIQALGKEVEASGAELEALRKEHEEKIDLVRQAKKALSRANQELEAALKDIASRNDEIEKIAAERTGIYRRCRLEEIDLPLIAGDLSSVKLNENTDIAPMDIDGDATQRAIDVPDFGIEVDFSELDEGEQADGGPAMAKILQDQIDDTQVDIDKMTPNMKANERLGDTELKLAETEKEFERSRRSAKEARDEFLRIKKRRCELFNLAYTHISERIDQVYKDLTKGKAAPMGGVAYLSLEDTEEPYNSGIKYHAMPPMKRFRDMNELSGGEKTMAALALLFAIHSFKPAPFFVLDEVDAALDSQNVAKVSNYIRQHASDSFQFIVISLKASLYERSKALVGIYRDQDQNSSSTLTLDLEQYA